MSDAYKRAAAKLEADKKADEARKRKARVSVAKVKYMQSDEHKNLNKKIRHLKKATSEVERNPSKPSKSLKSYKDKYGKTPSKNPAKSGRSALSSLTGKVKKEMAKYRAKKKPSKNPANTRTKQIKSAVGSALTSKELDRFRRKK